MQGGGSKLAEQVTLLTNDIIYRVAEAEGNFQQELAKLQQTCATAVEAAAKGAAAQKAAEERADAAEAEIRALRADQLSAQASAASAARVAELEGGVAELKKQLSAAEAKLAGEKSKLSYWYAKGTKAQDLEKELQQEKAQSTLLRLSNQTLQSTHNALQATYEQLRKDYEALAAASGAGGSADQHNFMPSQIMDHGAIDYEAMLPDADMSVPASQPAAAAVIAVDAQVPRASQGASHTRGSAVQATAAHSQQGEDHIPATAPSDGLSQVQATSQVAAPFPTSGAGAEAGAAAAPAADEDEDADAPPATQASAAKKRKIVVPSEKVTPASLPAAISSQQMPSAAAKASSIGGKEAAAAVGKSGSVRKASQTEGGHATINSQGEPQADKPHSSFGVAAAGGVGVGAGVGLGGSMGMQRAASLEPLGPLREKIKRLSQMWPQDEVIPDVVDDGFGSQIAPSHLDMSGQGYHLSQVDGSGTGGGGGGDTRSCGRPSVGAGLAVAAAPAAVSAKRRGSLMGAPAPVLLAEDEGDAQLQAALAPQFDEIIQDALRHMSQAALSAEQKGAAADSSKKDAMDEEEGEVTAAAAVGLPSASQSQPAPAAAVAHAASQPTSSQSAGTPAAAVGGIPKKAGGPSASSGLKRGRKSLLDGPEGVASQGAGAAAAAVNTPLTVAAAGQRASLLGKPPGTTGSVQLAAAGSLTKPSSSQQSPAPLLKGGGVSASQTPHAPLYSTPASSAVDLKALALTMPNYSPHHPAFLFSWDPAKGLPDARAPFDFGARGLESLGKQFPLVTKVIGLNPGNRTVGRNADVEMISSKVSRKQTVLETHVLPPTAATKNDPFSRVRTTLHNYGINGVYVWRKGKPLFVMQGKPTTSAPEFPSDTLELQHGDVICYLMCPYKRSDGWPVEKENQDKATALNLKPVPQGIPTHTTVHPNCSLYLTGPSAHLPGTKDTVADWPSTDGKGGPDPKDPRHCLNERHCWTTENNVHSGDNHQAPRVGYIWVYRVNEVALLSGEFDTADACRDRAEEALTCRKVDKTAAGSAAAAGTPLQGAGAASQGQLQTAPGTT